MFIICGNELFMLVRVWQLLNQKSMKLINNKCNHKTFKDHCAIIVTEQ